MKISICMSLKNRSKVLNRDQELPIFPNTMDSISALSRVKDLEVVIVDFKSDDTVLKDWIYDLKVDVTLIELDEDFSRGRGLNLAAENSKYEILFFTDADIMLDNTVVPRIEEVINDKKIWFPSVKFMSENGKTCDYMKHPGNGLAAIAKKKFEDSVKWPEFYSWGGEDHIFYWSFSSRRIVREEFPGLVHQFHPNATKWAHYKKPVQSCYKEYMAKKRKK